MSMDPFHYGIPDVQGCKPNIFMKGRRYRHRINGEVYTVTDFAWDGTQDLWTVLHQRPSCVVTFARTIRNFEERMIPE